MVEMKGDCAPRRDGRSLSFSMGTEECFTCTLDIEHYCYSELDQCFTKTNEYMARECRPDKGQGEWAFHQEKKRGPVIRRQMHGDRKATAVGLAVQGPFARDVGSKVHGRIDGHFAFPCARMVGWVSCQEELYRKRRKRSLAYEVANCKRTSDMFMQAEAVGREGGEMDYGARRHVETQCPVQAGV